MNNTIPRGSRGLGMVLAATLAALGPALADDAPAAPAAAAVAAAAPPAVLDPGATAWMLTSSVLVLMMTIPGLALFYGGMVRKKNVLAILMQCFAITALVTVLWVAVGYSAAFTEGSPWLGGFGRVFLAGMTLKDLNGVIPESVFVMFQATFAIITPALIVGAFADRMKFGPMLVFIGLWLLLVYVPIAHWVWGPKGYLNDLGVLDFAGGTVVHINAGIAGLVAAIVLGKRNGAAGENMSPHNLVLTMIGAALLWVGWFGFNAGSANAADGRAGMAMITTHTATATAVLAWTIAEWALRGKPSLLGACSGAVAGLVAITPACGFVDVKGAFIIGAAAGVGCFWGATGLKHLGGYDDALDVWGVHGVGGMIGALLTGVFAVKDIGGTAGVLEGNIGQLGLQALAVVVTLVWSGAISLILLKGLDAVVGIRVSEEVEVEGLDYSLHGATVH